jgi:predicted ribosome quality control (RQC) complex YloA/Tae2 family protein
MSQNELLRFFQENNTGYAALSMWQRKYSAILSRLQGTTLQKVSASDEGFLSLGVYKPGDDRSVVVFNIQKQGAGVSLEKSRPASQAKPNGMVQILRKYLLGRRIVSTWCSLRPVTLGMEFSPPSQGSPDFENLASGPDILLIDLDTRPARICLVKKHREVPNRYGHVSHAFKNSELDFFESFCEWSLDATKTKHRPTFAEPLITFSFLSPLQEAPGMAHEQPHPLPQDASSRTQNILEASHQNNENSHENMTLTKAFSYLPPHVRRAAKTRYQFLERRLTRQRADFPSEEGIARLSRRAQGLQIYLHLWPKGSPTWYVPADIISEYSLPAFFKLKAGQKPGDLLEEAFHELERIKRRQQELQTRIAQSEVALSDFANIVQAAAIEIDRSLRLLSPDEALTPHVVEKKIAQNSHRVNSESALRLCRMCDVEWLASGEKRKQAHKSTEQRLPYRTFHAFTGEFIRVSKSATDADAMLKIMPANHMWFHILTGEGSHVWLERPRGAKPTPRAIREAAILAIHYSKHSKTLSGEVRVATRADIERKKNLPPGKVLVRRCETMVCKYNDTELQRILASSHDKNALNE